MNKITALAGVAALAATMSVPAAAQVTDLSSSTSATLTLDGVNQPLGNPVPSPNYRNSAQGGAGYGTSAILGEESIFFQAGTMAAGRNNAATSAVEVSFKVTGQSPTEISRIASTIFESNFGFYVGSFGDFVDETTGDLVEGCRGANLPNCLPTTFEPGFSNFTTPGTGVRTLATTQFTFDVLQDGLTVRSISGSLEMQRSGSTISFVPGLGFDDLAGVLDGFEAFAFDNKVYSFHWDRTDFVADLLNPIGLGETSLITYRITSSSQNFALPVGANPQTNRIVAFACLADPVGRGGTAGAVFTIPGFGPNTCDDYSDGAGGTVLPYSLKIPRVVGGTLFFTAAPIPEADTWAMLIAGFGLVGLSMRRTKRIATVAA
jgi:hypothetical protein